MKVIFLDFNGVLDTSEKMDEIDFGNLCRLKKIVQKTNAKVVISSSLKNSYYRKAPCEKLIELLDTLKKQNIEVVGMTPVRETREAEIIAYLENHAEVENYCILDDDYEMPRLKDHLVKLPMQMEEGQKGLEECYMNDAIHILNTSPKLLHLSKF